MHTTDWRPRVEQRTETLAPPPAARLAATLDLADPPGAGDPLPPLWHWLYFLPDDPQATLAADGHPRRGRFLPPLAHRRRMHAGGRVTFLAPLRVGDEARRTSAVAEATEKHGSRGQLQIVTVRHEIAGPAGPAIHEEQDLVYTDAPPAGTGSEAAPIPNARWEQAVTPDEAMLFRFSALTFNAHRIHYDHGYATGEEGYPGLVVHGPLVALLLAELVRRHGASPASFSFRARAPFFAGRSIHLRGGPDGALAAYDPDGRLGMTASFA